MSTTRTPSYLEYRANRRSALRANLVTHNLDAMLVTDLTNIRYLTGFTGSNAALLLSAIDDGVSALYTDFRYREQAHAEVGALVVRIDRPCDLAALKDGAALRGAGVARIGFEEHIVTVREHRSHMEAAAAGVSLVGMSGLVENLRIVKDPSEIDALREACAIADTALRDLLEAGELREGRTEREAALDLDERMRRLGAEDAAFSTILAAGEHSAIPHHQPTDRPLTRGDLVKLDFGAVKEGYHSDMTRMFVLGEPADWQTDLYALVASAQRAGSEAIRDGTTAAAVDAAARDVIVAAGHGEHFGHGLGHGVGLHVHEAPWFAPGAAGIMACDMTVTVEPGVYLPGRGGVRIEDSGVVGPDGYVPLTQASRELVSL